MKAPTQPRLTAYVRESAQPSISSLRVLHPVSHTSPMSSPIISTSPLMSSSVPLHAFDEYASSPYVPPPWYESTIPSAMSHSPHRYPPPRAEGQDISLAPTPSGPGLSGVSFAKAPEYVKVRDGRRSTTLPAPFGSLWQRCTDGEAPIVFDEVLRNLPRFAASKGADSFFHLLLRSLGASARLHLLLVVLDVVQVPPPLTRITGWGDVLCSPELTNEDSIMKCLHLRLSELEKSRISGISPRRSVFMAQIHTMDAGPIMGPRFPAKPAYRPEFDHAWNGLVQLGLHYHGMRIAQAFVQICTSPLEKHVLRVALSQPGAVLRLAEDADGSHLITVVIRTWVDDIDWVIGALCGDLSCFAALALSKYGALVIERLVQASPLSSLWPVIHLVCLFAHELSVSEFGNYVLKAHASQAVVNLQLPDANTMIADKLMPSLVSVATHKAGSNILEALIRKADPHTQHRVASALASSDGVADTTSTLLRDKFGNYVLQTALEVCSRESLEPLLTACARIFTERKRGHGLGGQKVLEIIKRRFPDLGLVYDCFREGKSPRMSNTSSLTSNSGHLYVSPSSAPVSSFLHSVGVSESRPEPSEMTAASASERYLPHETYKRGTIAKPAHSVFPQPMYVPGLFPYQMPMSSLVHPPARKPFAESRIVEGYVQVHTSYHETYSNTFPDQASSGMGER